MLLVLLNHRDLVVETADAVASWTGHGRRRGQVLYRDPSGVFYATTATAQRAAEALAVPADFVERWLAGR